MNLLTFTWTGSPALDAAINGLLAVLAFALLWRAGSRKP